MNTTRPLARPVAAGTFGCPLPAFGVAEPRWLILEGVVERGIAHRAEDLLDLAAGPALAAEPDGTLSQGSKLL
jgi:hypothetical protein